MLKLFLIWGAVMYLSILFGAYGGGVQGNIYYETVKIFFQISFFINIIYNYKNNENKIGWINRIWHSFIFSLKSPFLLLKDGFIQGRRLVVFNIKGNVSDNEDNEFFDSVTKSNENKNKKEVAN